MPCRSDYLEPTAAEIEHAKVLALLRELAIGHLPDYFGKGSHPKVYGNTTQEKLDKATEELCTALQDLDVTQYSLEMQMWWRDHQAADKKRIEAELKQAQNEEAKEAAIAKLTPHERKLLGL